MNILIFSHAKPDKNSGVVAMDLYNSFKSYGGHDVKICIKKYALYDNNDIVSIDNSWTESKERIKSFSKIILNKLGFKSVYKVKSDRDYLIQNIDQTKTYYSTKRLLKKIDFKPDIIIVLFMQHFLSFKNLHELNVLTNAPILLYMMDLAPITGACHYTWACKNYVENCGKCPALFSTEELDQSRLNFIYKNKYVEKTNIIPIAASSWQYNKLLEANMFRYKDKYKVLLGINSEKFKPGKPIESRMDLGLPIDKKIIFFGAVSVLEDRRKGYKELKAALFRLHEIYVNPDEIHLAIAGNSESLELESLPFEFSALGSLNHQDLIMAYQASDVFVCPSIEEAGPMMINQSIMCGTPVVAFEMGVALDLVINGKTGFRAKLYDSADLALCINKTLNLNVEDYCTMRSNCREFGLENISTNKHYNQFAEIINKYLK